jgi:hypothetical protein
MRDLKRLSRLIEIALFLPLFVTIFGEAIATPVNKQTSCLDNEIFRSNFLPRFVLHTQDGSRINVRETPTVNSPVVYAAPSENPVFPQEQVVGDDNYCWLRVNFPSLDAGDSGYFSGWVRGDLVIISRWAGLIAR